MNITPPDVKVALTKANKTLKTYDKSTIKRIAPAAIEGAKDLRQERGQVFRNQPGTLD